MVNYFLKYLKINLKALIEFRLNFIFDIVIMIIINMSFLGSVLYISYSNNGFGEFNYKDILIALTINELSYSLGISLFKGVFDMQKNIISGRFDSLLIRPINSFFHQIISRIDFLFIGEFISCLILLYLNHFNNLPFILLFSFFGAIIFNISFSLYNCIPFFTDTNNDIDIFDLIINFSNYPPNVYNNFMKFLAFFIFPGAMISFVPIMILKNYKLIFLYVGFFVFLIISFVIVYNEGLKKYRSAGY